MKIDYAPQNATGINPIRLKYKRELEKILNTAPIMCGTCVECYELKCMKYDAEIDKKSKYMIQNEDDRCPSYKNYDVDTLYPEDGDDIAF